MAITCSNCFVGERGYTVYFSQNESSAFLDAYLPEFPPDHWCKINPRLFWMHESLFNAMLDYIAVHLQANGILAVETAKQDPYNGLDKLKPILSFKEARDAHWIDDIIRNRSIRTFYQPIVSYNGKNSSIIGYELLSRGTSQAGEIIPPVQLFQAAKARDRLFALDRACRLEAVKNAVGLGDGLVFINFLPTSIYNPQHCLQSTVDMVQRSGIRPESIVFEVVESEEIKNKQHLRSILEYYKAHGFRYALDDVGTGFNSLQVLAELEPDVVKLAIEFSRGIAKDKGKQRVARAVVQMTQELNSRALAEGIEDRDDLECLRDLGYEWFQGYYFGKPEPEPLRA
ncbi:EAL domain-containing protein [Paenibacillus lutrae]|uniref:EAL domain-containing protein n=1 Tax=Paenibacillus lutrae TaxID=2078573 RepID=A0A7X3K0Y3_9BACL|nr:EAL domain-containing protein [Paenibacillus lutrae]MVP01658.1 EAL domain-containing protein [Paenibacillus lutrae]